MTFLAPGFFFASVAVSAAIVALHFIVTRQPRAGILPTARFVPDLPATATARAARPSDVPLMLLRILLVLAAGTGLARPVLKPDRVADARVILVDVSRSVGDAPSLRDSVRSVYRDRDALILFDSAARAIGGNVADSIGRITPVEGTASMSAALIAALRAGSTMREAADSLELVIVSPLAAESMDAATSGIRRLWPGGIRIVRAGMRARDTTTTEGRLSMRSAPDDPLAVAVDLSRATGSAVIVRDGSDSRAGATSSSIPIDWPASSRPRGSVPRARRDTIGGVLAGNSLVVSAFDRRWSYPADSALGAQVIARWIDGEPAALEWKAGETCRRSAAIPVPAAGDLVIRKDFVRLVSAIAAPCIHQLPFAPMGANAMALLRGSGGLAPRDAFQPRGDTRSWLAPWLLALALACAVAELFVRRSKVRDARDEARPDRMRPAA